MSRRSEGRERGWICGQVVLMTFVVRYMVSVRQSRVYYDRIRTKDNHYNQVVRSFGRYLVRVIWRMLKNERGDEIEPKNT